MLLCLSFHSHKYTEIGMQRRVGGGGNPTRSPSERYLFAESRLEHSGLLLGAAHWRCFPTAPNFLAVGTTCLSRCWMKTGGLWTLKRKETSYPLTTAAFAFSLHIRFGHFTRELLRGFGTWKGGTDVFRHAILILGQLMAFYSYSSNRLALKSLSFNWSVLGFTQTPVPVIAKLGWWKPELEEDSFIILPAPFQQITDPLVRAPCAFLTR